MSISHFSVISLYNINDTNELSEGVFPLPCAPYVHAYS